MKVLYTAVATSTGDGRQGHVRSPDGVIDFDLQVPVELGGPGGAPNPELLFAAGYSACFHSALKRVARRLEIDPAGSAVTAHVGLGAVEGGAFSLSVALEVELPGADREKAQAAVERAHEVCPYSHATRGNIEVTLTLL